MTRGPTNPLEWLRGLVPLGLGGHNSFEDKLRNLAPFGLGDIGRSDPSHHKSFDHGKTTFSEPTYNSQFPTTWADRKQSGMAPGGPGIDRAILEKATQNFIHNDEAGDTRLGGKFTPAGLNKSVVDTQNNVADLQNARKMIGIGGTIAPNFERGSF